MTMKTPWKALITLAVAVPMLAYVVGALVAVDAAPRSHETIVLRTDSAGPDQLRPARSLVRNQPAKDAEPGRRDHSDSRRPRRGLRRLRT